MAAKYWIKLYHEILDDPKMGRLTDALFRRAVECFLAAGDFNRGGALPPLKDLAWRLRADEETLREQMLELEKLHILSREGDSAWLVTHFKERQSAAPTAERVRRHRENVRKWGDGAPEPRNAAVTKRYTDTDTEADTEAEKRGEEKGKKGSAAAEPEDELVQTFIAQTKIPLNAGGEGKWADALARMKAAGVTKGDLLDAIHECRGKGLTIATLASAVNPAIIAMSRRVGAQARENPEEDYRRYMKGEYGDVGVP